MSTKNQKTAPTDKKTNKQLSETNFSEAKDAIEKLELINEQIKLEKEIRKKELAEISRRWDKTSKPYIQTSKKVVMFCLFDFLIVEIFTMVMIWRTAATDQIMYLITSIAITCLGAVIWYMKNSEAEKKARINVELERMKLKKVLKENAKEEDEDTEDVAPEGVIDDTQDCEEDEDESFD